MSISAEIERLRQLRDEGAMSEEEFQEAKARVLQNSATAGDPFAGTADQIYGIETKMWCMLMHLSQLLNAALLGAVVPIVMWAFSKDKSREADRHGIMIINWIISSLIYLAVSGILSFAIIGIPFFWATLLLMIVFPIVGAIKAINGEFWKYPLTIKFLKDPGGNDLAFDEQEPTF